MGLALSGCRQDDSAVDKAQPLHLQSSLELAAARVRVDMKGMVVWHVLVMHHDVRDLTFTHHMRPFQRVANVLLCKITPFV